MASQTFTANGSKVLQSRSDGLLRTYLTAYVIGDLGAGTVTLEVSPDASHWLPTDVVFTAEGFASLQGRFVAVRATLSGATAPAFSVWLW